MNISGKTIVLGVLALGLAGCLSVEGMKAKLNSGDPEQIADAEESIIHAAGSWDSRSSSTPKQVVEDCVALLNNKALFRLIDGGYGYFLDHAASCVKFSNDEEAAKAVRDGLEWGRRREQNSNNNRIDNTASAYGVVMERAVEYISTPATLRALYGNAAYGNFNSLQEKMANRLCEVEMDQSALADVILEYGADDEYKEKAFGRIADVSAKLKLLKDYHFKDRVMESLSESEITDYILGAVDENTYEIEFKKKNDLRQRKTKSGVAPAVQLQVYTIPRDVNLIERVNDQNLLAKIVLNAKYYQISAAEKIADKSIKLDLIKKLIPVWEGVKVEDGTAKHIYSLLETLATEQDGLRELVKNLGIAKKLDKSERFGFYGHKKIIERISDADIADTMYETMPLRWNDETVSIVKALIAKMSVEKKSKIASLALESAKGITDHIVFESFWVGMPIADFFVLAEHMGVVVNASTKRISKEGVWHKNFVVSEMIFPLKSCQKFLDCEDSEILSQTIHKYVMHKDGKCSALEYLGLINYEVAHTETRRFNLMSGFSTDHDFKNWATYSNTKLGTKIWFSEERGVLRFTML